MATILDVVLATLNALLTIVVFTLFLVFTKVLGRYPSELDKIGSDINLCGIGISLFPYLGLIHNQMPFFGIESKEFSAFFSVILFLAAYISYWVNLDLSGRIRELDASRYRNGVETFEELHEVLASPRGRHLMTVSLAVAFFPILIVLALFVIWGHE